MKIVIVTDAIYPFSLGGSEIRNYEIGKRLVKKGHDVYIYGAQQWEGSSQKEIDGIKIKGVYKYPSLYTSSGRRSVLHPLILSWKIYLSLKKEKFDIIENATFVYFNCFSTKIISWKTKTPLVFVWHQYFGDYLIGYFGKTIGNIAIIIERISTKLCKNNLCVSEKVKKDLIKMAIPEKYCNVIYNGVDLNLMNYTKSFETQKYDLIFVGRLNYQKNVSLLIEAAKILITSYPNIKICIIGDGQEKEALLKMIRNYKLEKNFDLQGEIKNKEKVFALMKSSKIFVLPSLLEGFPLTIIEANSAGLPIITTKSEQNNTSEYVIDGENGLLSSLSKECFVEKINLLLSDSDLRQKMSINGIKKASTMGWDEITNQLESYYIDVINKNKS